MMAYGNLTHQNSVASIYIVKEEPSASTRL